VTLIVPACPQMGVPLPLDGTRVVFGDASFPQDIPVTKVVRQTYSTSTRTCIAMSMSIVTRIAADHSRSVSPGIASRAVHAAQ